MQLFSSFEMLLVVSLHHPHNYILMFVQRISCQSLVRNLLQKQLLWTSTLGDLEICSKISYKFNLPPLNKQVYLKLSWTMNHKVPPRNNHEIPWLQYCRNLFLTFVKGNKTSVAFFCPSSRTILLQFTIWRIWQRATPEVHNESFLTFVQEDKYFNGIFSSFLRTILL